MQVENRLPVESAQAAVEVADRRPEEEPADRGEHRVAEVLVQRRHRAGLDPAAEPVAHDQVVAGAQPLDELVEVGEVVAVVGVAHDHVGAARRRDAAEERGPVPLVDDVDDARTVGFRDLLRAVGAAVVGDDDLADDAAPVEVAPAPCRCRWRASPPR